MASQSAAAATANTASPHSRTRAGPHLNWIPLHLRGPMAAYGALGQVGSAHGLYQKLHSGGLAAWPAPPTPSAGPNDACQETKSLTLDWKVSDLKTIFDSSRGDAKSRCIKSPPFGDGRWEIYFYGNSGSDYVSLYLSAEPTIEERERGLKFAARSRSYTAAMLAKSASNPALAAAAAAAVANKHAQQPAFYPQSSPNASASSANNAGPFPSPAHSAPWIREGSYRFAFEIKSVNKKEAPIKMMEAADHVFSSEARNWGWQSFARRADVYYNNMVIRHSDLFIISCTITHTPSRPTLPAHHPTLQKRLMPLELVNAFAGMFDDPAYSDVRFVITSRSPITGKKKEKSLYAIRKILAARAEYFDTMFSSGFSEAKNMTSSDGHSASRRPFTKSKDDIDHEDSDMESVDSDEMMVMYDSASDGEQESVPEDGNEDTPKTQEVTRIDRDMEDDLTASDDEDEGHGDAESHTAHTSINESSVEARNADTEHNLASASSSKSAGHSDAMKVDTLPLKAPTSPSKLHHTRLPSSPSRRYPTRHFFRETLPDAAVEYAGTSTMRSVSTNAPTTSPQAGSPRSQRYQKRVETRTESEGSHQQARQEANENNGKQFVTVVVKDASYSTYKALLYFLYTDTITFAPLSSIYAHAKDTAEAHNRQFSYRTRKQFFDAYTAAVYGPSSPQNSQRKDLICSSKAMYKIADKLNILELKNKAFEHIVQSLTIESIPYEVFSAFSQQFPEVRKVQLDMMLHYWNEIREGQAMKNILRLIRLEPERFPGYEEVWQHLLLNLEYRANSHAGVPNTSLLKESPL